MAKCRKYSSQVDLCEAGGQPQAAKERKKAIEWYNDKRRSIGSYAKSLKNTLLSQAFRKSAVDPGQMAMFYYSPKHQKTLPYYDTHPLIVVIGPAKPSRESGPGILGLNLHYLPPRLRAILFDQLVDLGEQNKKKPRRTAIMLTYAKLKAMGGTPYYKPCIKHYLKKHLKSRYVVVSRDEWERSIFLPNASFRKASEREVWSESVKKAK